MGEPTNAAPDSSAVRTALWRALHLEVDAPPHVFEDRLGLTLAAPEEGWRARGDMHPMGTRPFRASIVARARFVEDLVIERAAAGLAQYVILGAGLDTFAERRPELAATLRVFEVDAPATQAWKRRRLEELGMLPPHLSLVPVDFERGETWRARLAALGFDATRPAVLASLGVSMYLTREAVIATLRDAASLAPGSTLVLSFMLPIERAEPALRPAIEGAARGARASGTPWRTFLTPEEALALARDAGFSRTEHVSADALSERYFAGRADGMRLPSHSEELLVATA